MRINKTNRFPLGLAILGIFFLGGLAGCSEENEVSDDEGIQPVVSDPSLNNFIITSRGSEIITVDAQTGQENVLLTFNNFIRPANIADYANGYIVLPANDNSVNAVDVNSGDLVWDAPMLEYQSARYDISPTICQDNTCYTSGAFGVVVATDVGSGEVQWHYTVDPNGFLDDLSNDAHTPVIRGDKIYVVSARTNDQPAYIHVLDKATGALLMKKDLPYNRSGELTFDGDLLLVPAFDLYALNAETLETVWTFEANNVGTPSVVGNRIAVQGIPIDDEFFSRLFCLDRNTGGLIWEVETGARAVWDPVIVGDRVFGIHEADPVAGFDNRNGRPFAVRLSDGNTVWSYIDANVGTVTSLTYANGRLFFHGNDFGRGLDGLVCLDAATGESLWLNDYFSRDFEKMPPLVVAQNGIFGPSYYRGNQ